jgi:hypothetical protein
MSRAVLMLATLALLALVGAGSATAGSPAVHAAGKCHLSSHEQRHLGASYVTSLSVKKTSCKRGKGVVKAFNACRHKHGKGGRCTSKVKGYSCSEKRTNGPGSYDSKTTCTNGGKRVSFAYVQNT